MVDMLEDPPLCRAAPMGQVRCLHPIPISCRPSRQPVALSTHHPLHILVRIGRRSQQLAIILIFQLIPAKMACTQTEEPINSFCYFGYFSNLLVVLVYAFAFATISFLNKGTLKLGPCNHNLMLLVLTMFWLFEKIYSGQHTYIFFT